MRTINNNRVLVQCVSKEDKDRFLTAIKEKANTLKVSSPKKRNPNVLLKNLPNEISDHDVLQLLKDQNPELEEKVQFWEETKIRFTLKNSKTPAFGFRNESKLSKFVPEFEVPESKLERL
ncbi:uncharacterized protein TNCV_4669291 [Trichonephila clavipes]|nr:uncharacterized protein TNCV_4669291 [Trichonephila clavipes]